MCLFAFVLLLFFFCFSALRGCKIPLIPVLITHKQRYMDASIGNVDDHIVKAIRC